MTTELISTLNPVAFVPHRSVELDEFRALLTSSTVDIEEQTLSLINAELLEHDPLRALAICIALVEVTNWRLANQAIASYLQYYPGDEHAIALLAFSLASCHDFEQAHIILSRAFSFLNQRQYSPQITPEQTQALEKKVYTFRLLEELIFKEESPAELIFSDQATLQISLPNDLNATLNTGTGDFESNLSHEPIDENLDPLNYNSDLDDSTFKDLKIQDYLQRIEQLAQEEAQAEVQPVNSSQDQDSLEIDLNDTQLHHLSDYDDHLIEDQMTAILKDAEAREQDTQHTYYPSTLVFDSSSQIEGSDLEPTLSVHESTAKLDTGFISQIEYLSEFSDMLDTDSNDLSMLESSSSFVHPSLSMNDSSNLLFDSTERMKSLSNTMMEEERQRIESILSQQKEVNLPVNYSDENEALVVQAQSDVVLPPSQTALKDPLLYPETLTPSLSRTTASDSSDSLPKLPSKIPPTPKLSSPVNQSTHLVSVSASASSHPDQVQVSNSQSENSIEPPFRRAKPPLPPIPSARRHKNKQATDSSSSQNEAKQSSTHPTSSADQASPSAIAPPIPPASVSPASQPTVATGQKSPLERLSAGEINVPYVAPLSASSSPEIQRQKNFPTPVKGPYVRSPGSSKSSWGLWLLIALASYFSLMSAFHFKSEHLLQQTQLALPIMNPTEFEELEDKLSQTISHPIGKSIDWLSLLVPNSELSQKRQKTFHHLAWISTTRWVLFGEDKTRDFALKMIRLALSKSPNMNEGRAALGLAFIAFDQAETAQAIIQALPKDTPYRAISLAWLHIKASRLDKSLSLIQTELKSHTLNQWLRDQVIYLEALLNKESFSNAYQNLNLEQDLKEQLYTPQRIPKKQALVDAKLLTYLKQHSPQKQRDFLDLLINELINRRDRIGLQTLSQELSLGLSSPSRLLLPSLSLALLELNLKNAEPIYRLMLKLNQSGFVSSHDLAQATVMWSLFTGHKRQNNKQLFSFTAPEIVKSLGQFSGLQVSSLMNETSQVNAILKQELEAIYHLYHSEWASLERIGASLPSKSKQLFQKIAQSHLGKHYKMANKAFKALEEHQPTILNGIFTQATMLHGVITNAFDQGKQVARHFQTYAQTESLPALKWLSQAWHCHLLSESSQLGLLKHTCVEATRLNPLDYRSMQTLAYAWLEVGQIEQARVMLSKIPKKALSAQGYELYLRLNFDTLQTDQEHEGNPDFFEFLSAETGLRFGSLLRFIEQQVKTLSRHELYRATWVAKYFGTSPQLFNQLLQSAIQKGSLIARLDYARQSLFMSNNLDQTTVFLDPATRFEANAEPETAIFVSLFDTLKCLALNARLDLHHYSPLMGDKTKANSISQPIKTKVPPQACRTLISTSLSSFKTMSSIHLPLLQIGFAQLLISLGYEEKATLILQKLLSQEPTFIEAKIAYSLLLLRASKSPDLNAIKTVIKPIENELYQGRGVQALYTKLSEYGVIQ